MNSILKSIGLTKDQIAKMLGLKPADQPKPRTLKTKRRIPKHVAESILSDKSGRTLEELANKHKVSVYYVWSVKNKHKQR